MDEALAVSLQKRNHLFALVDFELRHQFAISGRVSTGKKKLVGFVAGVGNRVEDSFLHSTLLPAKPAEAGNENGQGCGSGDEGREDEELNVITFQAGRDSVFHTLIRIPHLGGKSK
jgi:hypothetical protein